MTCRPAQLSPSFRPARGTPGENPQSSGILRAQPGRSPADPAAHRPLSPLRRGIRLAPFLNDALNCVARKRHGTGRTAMTITETTTVADVAAAIPSSVRIFERLGIDFCCGGRTPLAAA